jgi:hypothetical protein
MASINRKEREQDKSYLLDNKLHSKRHVNCYYLGSQRRTRLAVQERVRRLRSGEQSQVLSGPAATGALHTRRRRSGGDPWEASDWPLSRKATHLWLFYLRRNFQLESALSPIRNYPLLTSGVGLAE